jgi:hypothetical protein
MWKKNRPAIGAGPRRWQVKKRNHTNKKTTYYEGCSLRLPWTARAAEARACVASGPPATAVPVGGGGATFSRSPPVLSSPARAQDAPRPVHLSASPPWPARAAPCPHFDAPHPRSGGSSSALQRSSSALRWLLVHASAKKLANTGHLQLVSDV